MKNYMLAASALSLLVASPALADTVTFDELAGPQQTFMTLDSGGLSFVNTSPRPDSLLVWDINSTNNADQGGATLSNNIVDTTTTVTLTGGGLFDFNSIDLADVFNSGGGGDIRFDFSFDGGGSSSSTVTIDNALGLETFTFNLTGLNSFAYTPLTTQGAWVQVDNIVFNNAIGAVPEPATWAFMIAGFGFIGGAMRRRRNSVSVSYA